MGRFIPTGVGNTLAAWATFSTTAVHPHGRGEHRSPRTVMPSMFGSSPRAWGTPNSRAQSFASTAVHPHGRGEHPSDDPAVPLAAGSSPRAWGTRNEGRFLESEPRFIPTGVGNTAHSQSRTPPRPVHPHGRGEHIRRTPITLKSTGSSPRAWGTHLDERCRRRPGRFIPTGVGNTASAASPIDSPAVHPHGRGEHAVHFPNHQTVFRFIPTGVGNTIDDATELRVFAGSSPRAWGTHDQIATHRAARRFIPTGVGNTLPPSP